MQLDFNNESTFTPKWKGNDTSDSPFTVTIRDMDLVDLIVVADAMTSVKLTNDTIDAGNIPVTEIKTLLVSAKDILPKYCSVSDLTFQNGNAVTIQDIVSSSRYIDLMLEIFSQMVNVSEVSETDQKNLPEQSV